MNLSKKNKGKYLYGFWLNNVTAMDLFSNQILEFLSDFVENMP